MRMRRPKDLEEVLSSCDFYYRGNFKNNNEVYLEVGIGKGDFIIGMAKAYPNINFIGIERNKAVLSYAIKKIKKEALDNIKIIDGDIVDYTELLNKRVTILYLNFSDPWPKDRHAKRRLTHENQLREFDKVFICDKQIILKTDNDDFFEYSLESLKNYGYTLKEKSYDLHKEDKINVQTEYEKRFSKRGVKIKYAVFTKKG